MRVYCIANLFFDDHCGTQVELGDASQGILGILGILRILRILRKYWGVMRYPVGLHVAVVTVLPLRQSHEP